MSHLQHNPTRAFLAGLVSIMLFMPMSVTATTFTHGFETVGVSTVSDITLNNNGLSATLKGGTAFTIGNGALYKSGVASWMLDPTGTTSRGISDGTGTTTFSAAPEHVQFFIRNSSSLTVASVQVIDENASVITEVNANSATWTEVNVTRITGESLIASLRFVVSSGSSSGMLAMDELVFRTPTATSTPAPTNNGVTSSSGGGGAFNAFFLLMMLLGVFIRKFKIASRHHTHLLPSSFITSRSK